MIEGRKKKEEEKSEMAWWLSWLERRPVTAEVVGSNPIRVAYNCISVVQICRHGGTGRRTGLKILRD